MTHQWNTVPQSYHSKVPGSQKATIRWVDSVEPLKSVKGSHLDFQQSWLDIKARAWSYEGAVDCPVSSRAGSYLSFEYRILSRLSECSADWAQLRLMTSDGGEHFPTMPLYLIYSVDEPWEERQVWKPVRAWGRPVRGLGLITWEVLVMTVEIDRWYCRKLVPSYWGKVGYWHYHPVWAVTNIYNTHQILNTARDE